MQEWIRKSKRLIPQNQPQYVASSNGHANYDNEGRALALGDAVTRPSSDEINLTTSGQGGVHLLTLHGALLVYLSQHQGATYKEMSQTLGTSTRTVARLVAELESEGHLIRSKRGRRNVYSVNPTLHLRRPYLRDITNGQLVEAVLHAKGMRASVTSGIP